MTDTGFDRDKVLGVVQRLAKQIPKDAKKGINERTTVYKYVAPLLEALGWTLEEDRLQLEYPVEGGSVDLALLVEDKPIAFVEAKRLREDLSLRDQEARQALRYGSESGTLWCVLTNGDRYEIYNAFRQVAVEKKLVTAFSVLEAVKAPEAELPKLKLLSLAAVTGGELERYARQQFAHDRVRELLEKPPSSVMSALCAELKGCGMTPDDVKLGLMGVLGKPVKPPPPEPPRGPEPPQPPLSGVRAHRPPLRVEGERIIVDKLQPRKGSVTSVWVSLETLEWVATAAHAVAQTGELISVPTLWEQPDPPGWVHIRTALGILFVAGVLTFERAGHAEHFTIAGGLRPTAIIQQVLDQAGAK